MFEEGMKNPIFNLMNIQNKELLKKFNEMDQNMGMNMNNMNNGMNQGFNRNNRMNMGMNNMNNGMNQGFNLNNRMNMGMNNMNNGMNMDMNNMNMGMNNMNNGMNMDMNNMNMGMNNNMMNNMNNMNMGMNNINMMNNMNNGMNLDINNMNMMNNMNIEMNNNINMNKLMNVMNQMNQVSQLINKMNQMNQIINDLKNQLNEKINECNLLKIELKNMQNYYIEFFDNLNKLLEEKDKNLNDKIILYEKLSNKFEKIKNKNLEFQKIIEELEKCKFEKNNEILEKNNIIKNGETNIDFINNSAEKYYDIVIDINSICSLNNDGWEIKYNKERKSIFHKIINEQTIKIGVLGLNNVGKSYLLSKMVKVEIPTGYSIETKGISIKYSQENKGEEKGICILDSAGLETPLLNDKDIEYKTNEYELNKELGNKKKLENLKKYEKMKDELSRDKAQTERFIEQLIISLSDIIILVIGKLTRTEQRLICRIKNLAKKNQNNKIKSIIIVHNLAQYHKIIEVKNHIEKYLNKSATFKLEKKNVIGIKEYKDRSYFIEKLDDLQDIEVFHYIMAKEGTEAGDYYNNLTMELIKSQYNIFNNRSKIDIPKQIIKLFCDLSEEIIGKKVKIDELDIINNNKIKFKEKQNSLASINRNFYVQNAFIDQDGYYLQRFEPKYSLYFYKEYNNEDEEMKYLLLRIEIPGNIVRLTARNTDSDKERSNGILIKVIKKRDEFPEISNENLIEIADNRIYDEFSYFIELKPNLILSHKNAYKDTEIYKIKFDKKNKEKFFLNKEKREIKNKNINNKEIESEMIGSGVYILRFELTQLSYL